MMNQAVVLGSNYYIGLSIIRCLGKENIHVVAMDYNRINTYGASSKYLKEQLIVPYYKNEAELLEYLIRYGKMQSLKPVLYPTADAYVAFMDKHLEELKEYYLIPMTEQGLWTKVMNKAGLQELAEKHHVKIPATMNADSIDWSNFNDLIGFPCLLKPTDSPGFVNRYRKKMFVCNNKESLLKSIEQAQSDGFSMIVQRKIVGADSNVCTYDCYLNQSSQVSHSMTCQKIRQFPINYGASSYTLQRHIEVLHQIGQRFLEAIGFKGFAEIEFKRDDRNDEYYLIEVNTRTTTLNCLLEKAGINFPLVAYKELTGQALPKNIFKASTNYTFRYHIEDLISIVKYFKTHQLTLVDYLKNMRYKTIYAIWSFDDPKPYFTYMKNKILRK
ncbi:MAG: carboxylate--amine ligase [Clostridiales bacterium]|nr:carboxylate--amine ligase [Clostridiales bacterium]